MQVSVSWRLGLAALALAVSLLFLSCNDEETGGSQLTQIGLRIVTTTPAPTLSPSPRPTPTATPSPKPTPTPKPTPKPKPTPRPARLVFGKLSYTANACWYSNWIDGEGHNRPGIDVKFSVKVTNRGQVRSDYLWLKVVSTDFVPTEPGPYHQNWGGFGSHWNPDEYTGVMGGPRIKPGESRTLTWRVKFHTAGDAHYEVSFVPVLVRATEDGDGVFAASMGIPVVTWKRWSSSHICR